MQAIKGVRCGGPAPLILDREMQRDEQGGESEDAISGALNNNSGMQYETVKDFEYSTMQQ